MERLTTRNIAGVAVYKHPFECERCGETIYRLPDYGNGSPTEKLSSYEDADEHGLLLWLPCKVGSNIYRITDDGVDVAVCREIRVADEEMYIESVTLCDWISFDEIGKTVFLSEAEAEAKLAEMEGAE